MRTSVEMWSSTILIVGSGSRKYDVRMRVKRGSIAFVKEYIGTWTRNRNLISSVVARPQ